MFKPLRRAVPAGVRSGIRWGVISVSLVLMLQPAWAAISLTGKPTPYKALVDWADTNLQIGSPIVVDRWFEPWNELRSYPASNVVFTFTVPDEPVENFRNYKWRDTVKQFMAMYSHGAYAEIRKNYWDVPDIGPWNWPGQYFVNHTQIVNRAGMILRETGLGYREDYYNAHTNGLIVDVFYNRPQDLPEVARRLNRPVLIGLEPGWGYVKNWRQGDFQPWRTMVSEAGFTIYNVSGKTLFVDVALVGQSVGGIKLIQASTGAEFRFPTGKMSVWKMERLVVPPSGLRVGLRDPLPSMAGSTSTLHLRGVQIVGVTDQLPSAPLKGTPLPPSAVGAGQGPLLVP